MKRACCYFVNRGLEPAFWCLVCVLVNYVCRQPVDITSQLLFLGVEIDLHLISLLLDNEHRDQVQCGIQCGQR